MAASRFVVLMVAVLLGLGDAALAGVLCVTPPGTCPLVGLVGLVCAAGTCRCQFTCQAFNPATKTCSGPMSNSCNPPVANNNSGTICSANPPCFGACSTPGNACQPGQFGFCHCTTAGC